MEEGSLDDDDEDAVVDEAALEYSLDDDGDDTTTEVLDIADVDRAMRDVDSSSRYRSTVEKEKKATGRFAGYYRPVSPDLIAHSLPYAAHLMD